MREMVEVVQADSRHDHLDFRAAVPRSEPLDELPFAGSARSKIGVAALGGRWHEVAPVVEQERLAHAGPGRQQRGVAAQVRRAGLQHVELLGMEHGDGMRDGHQVVQQSDSRQPELERHRLAVDGPRHVGQLGRIVEHRTGHAKAGGFD